MEEEGASLPPMLFHLRDCLGGALHDDLNNGCIRDYKLVLTVIDLFLTSANSGLYVSRYGCPGPNQRQYIPSV